MPPLNNFQKSCIALAVSQSIVHTSANAATIVVGTDLATECSLMDAITSANTDMATGFCVAGSGADVIQMHNLEVVLPFATAGNSALLVSSDITIEGKSSNASNQGGLIGRDTAAPEFRLFEVTPGGSLTLKDMALVDGALINGEDGGAIRVLSGGSLTMMNSTLTRNSVSGTDARGGAIYAAGNATVNLQYTNVYRNTATQGGGIAIRGGEGGGVLNGNVNAFRSNSATGVGGGVWLGGSATATLTNTLMNNNSATLSGGGAYTNGQLLSFNGGEFFGNSSDASGGAIAAAGGAVEVSNIRTYFNRAYTSGGFADISGSAALNVNRSSLTTNSVNEANNGPQADIRGQGGAISLRSNAVHTIANSTISNNRASDGGALYTSNGSLTLLNTTIVGGEGIPEPNTGNAAIALSASDTATVTLQNSVFARGGEGYQYGGVYGAPAGTSSLNGRLLCVSSGSATINNSTGNFAQDASCGMPATIDLGLSRLRTSSSTQSFRVGTAKGRSNGGSTYTNFNVGQQKYHTPVFDSPLLGAGDLTVCGSPMINSFDQRGRVRSLLACESGATEAAVGSVIIDSASDDLNSTANNCSLRDALITTSGIRGGEGGETPRVGSDCGNLDVLDIATLTFDQTEFPSNGSTTITLSQSLPTIRASVSIQGPGKEALTIDGDGQSRLLTANNANLYLSNMSLANGYSGSSAGLSLNRSKVRLDSIVLRDNSAQRSAGGLSSSNTELTIVDSTITDNFSSRDGIGGIRLSGTGLTIIESSTISGNVGNDNSSTSTSNVGRYAGGLYVGENSVAVLRNSTVSGNSSVRTGGGIAVRNGSLTLLNSTVTGNTADVRGGGIYIVQYINGGSKYDVNPSAEPTILNSIVSGNRKGDGTYGAGVAEYGNEIALMSWESEPRMPRTPGDPISLSTLNSLLGDSAATYAEAFYSSANVMTTLGLGNSTIATSTDVATNPNQASTALDAILEPLADNGGMTLTHNLVNMSPAINGGENSICEGSFGRPITQDQRGIFRNDLACDIGSVEYQDQACFVIVTKDAKGITFCL